MTDTGNELSEILSPEPAPAVTVTAEPTITPEPVADTGQPRGPDGKFATKAEPEPTAQPAVTATQPEPTTIPEGFVPHGRFHAVNETAKAEKERADRLETMLQQALQRQPQPQPAPAKEQPKPVDWWDNPEEHSAAQARSVVAPVEEMVRGMIFQSSLRDAMRAEGGSERVKAANDAIKEAMQRGDPEALALAQRVMKSFDPVGDVVSWHQRQSAISRVGNDPDKWLEAELEKRLLDPAEQAKILARIQASATQRPNGQTPAIIKPPPSINGIPGGTSTASTIDMDEGARFARAIGR